MEAKESFEGKVERRENMEVPVGCGKKLGFILRAMGSYCRILAGGWYWSPGGAGRVRQGRLGGEVVELEGQ